MPRPKSYEEDDEPVDLALIMAPGKAKGGSKKKGGADEVPSDFESAAVEAFPDLAEDPERIAALKRAIMACYEAEG